MSDNTTTKLDRRKFDETLAFFKALGDQTRLKIIGLLLDGEHNVGDLAELLDLKEPTVSHHLSVLRPIGLVTLRSDGNQRFYRLNVNSLRKAGQSIGALEAFRFEQEVLESDYGWLDKLDLDNFARKTLRDYTTPDQRLKQIPRKQLKLIVVLDWLGTFFEPDRVYTEKEVNEILTQRHDDYASLRRDMVDMWYFRRDPRGSKYLFQGALQEHF